MLIIANVCLNFLDNGFNCTLTNELCSWKIEGRWWYFYFNKGRFIIADKLLRCLCIERRVKGGTMFNKTRPVFHFIILKIYNSIWFLHLECMFTSCKLRKWKSSNFPSESITRLNTKKSFILCSIELCNVYWGQENVLYHGFSNH